MVILRAIGGFFAKIGRWIKNTAWVQPLLIVGGIFAIIFAINPISKWVGSWFASGEESNSYYRACQLSWDGVENDKSDVQLMLKYISSNLDEEADLAAENKFGKKFFLCFTQDACDGCKENYYGFRYAQKKWNNNDEFSFANIGKDAENFKIYSINIGIEDNDGNNLFTKYVYGEANVEYIDSFFEECSQLWTYYGSRTFSSKKDLQDRLVIDSQTSPINSPTCFLYDRGYEVELPPGSVGGPDGIAEVFFQYEGKKGSDELCKARTVWDCWNHLGNFSKEGIK